MAALNKQEDSQKNLASEECQYLRQQKLMLPQEESQLKAIELSSAVTTRSTGIKDDLEECC